MAAEKGATPDGGHGADPRKAADKRRPVAADVNDFHWNSDLDTGPWAQHHSLGIGPTQAAPGSHVHDGVDSPLLLDGFELTGAKGTSAYYLSLSAILQRLGVTDSST